MQVAAALSLTALLCPVGGGKVRRVDPCMPYSYMPYSPANKMMCYASPIWLKLDLLRWRRNHRHKAILFVTLVVSGCALLLGAQLREAVGFMMLGVAFAWAIGSNYASKAYTALKGTSGTFYSWIRPFPIAMALAGDVYAFLQFLTPPVKHEAPTAAILKTANASSEITAATDAAAVRAKARHKPEEHDSAR